MSEGGKTTYLQNLVAGLAAGVTEAVLVVTPFEVVKTRMQAQVNREKDPLSAAARILKKEGVAGFWKGGAPTAFRQGTNQMSMFSTYSFLREHWWKVGEKESLSPYQAACSGIIAGMVGPLLNCPADVIKTRLMNQTHSLVEPEMRYKGFRDAFRRIRKEEGFLALYKGILPRLARVAPGQAIAWIVVEQFSAFWH